MKKILIPIAILMVALLLSSCQMAPFNQNKNPTHQIYSIEKLANADYIEGRVIVGYEEYSIVKKVSDLLNTDVAVNIPKLKAVSFDLNGMSVKDALLKLAKSDIKGIRYAEPVFNRHLIDPKPTSSILKNNPPRLTSIVSTTTEDPMMVNQWAFNKINPYPAWNAGDAGSGVAVAVVDTPVDGQHPDLIGQFVTGYDPELDFQIAPNTNYQDDSNPNDDHGTHVSGIIAAAKNNLGVRGLAYNAKIMPILIFRADSAWGYHYVGDDYVAKGIVWAVDHGAKVLSNSWGGIDYSQLLKDAIDYTLAHSAVFVVAMGNESEDLVEYPAAYPGVIAVAASNARDGIADFSTRGPHVAVAAPGVNVLSCIPRASGPIEGINGQPYDYWDGTSMATPYVSAIAAILFQLHPNYTPYQIEKLIELGADDLAPVGFDRASGYGRINVGKSVTISTPPETSGILDVSVNAKRDGDGIPAVSVTLHSANGRDYYAQTDDYGVAKFLSINSGDYEVYVGGPDFLNPNAWNWRQEEEEASNTSVTVTTTLATKTFTFSSTMSVNLAFDTSDTYTLHLVHGIYGTYDSTTVNGTSLSYSLPNNAPSGQYYLEVTRTSTGATVDVIGSISTNHHTISISGEFGASDSDIFVDEANGYEIPTAVF